MPITAKITIISILVFINITLVNCNKKTDQEKADDSLKIGTFNIHFYEPGKKINSWDKRKEVLYNLIAQENPDIIGFQEVYTHSHKTDRSKIQFEWLKDKFENYSIVSNEETTDLASSLPIFYKKDKLTLINQGHFFFTKTPGVNPAQGKGHFTVYFCNWGYFFYPEKNYYFYIFNIHLSGRNNKNNARPAQIINNQINKIKKENEGLIVIGDFNEFYNSQTLKTFYTNGFKNTIKGPWPATLHLFIGLRLIPRIDHILINDYFELKNYHISRHHESTQYPSDHFPVFVDLTKN